MLTLYEGKHLEIETRYWVNASSWNTTKIFLPELLIYFHCVHYSLFRVAPEFCVILFYIFPTFLTKSEQIMLFISNLQTIFISNFLFDRVRQSLPMGIYLFSIYQKICFKYWTLSPRRFQSNQQEKLVCICKVQNSKFLTQVHFFSIHYNFKMKYYIVITYYYILLYFFVSGVNFYLSWNAIRGWSTNLLNLLSVFFIYVNKKISISSTARRVYKSWGKTSADCIASLMSGTLSRRRSTRQSTKRQQNIFYHSRSILFSLPENDQWLAVN